MFFQRGKVRSDSDEESAFMALSISMTTRMERETVEAALAEESEKMWQPIDGKMVLQLWKWVWKDC
jgi:hypothetical protein